VTLFAFSGLAYSAGDQESKKTIVMLGDSIFAYPLTTRVASHLQKKHDITVKSFAENGAHYLPESISVINNMPPIIRRFIDKRKAQIPKQFANFVEGKIQDNDYVILDGGGNDIFATEELCLENDCPSVLDDISDAQMNMLETLESYGVKNVIYQGYYRTKGPKAPLIPLILKGNKMLRENCAKFSFCNFIDPAPYFKGKSGMIISDGIHPTSKGSMELARLIYLKMALIESKN